MMPMRLQHVTGTMRRLPLGTPLATQAAWFSCSRRLGRSAKELSWTLERRRQEKENKDYWFEERGRQRKDKMDEIKRRLRGEDLKASKEDASKLPSVRPHRPPPHPVDFKTLRKEHRFKRIFLDLDIGLAALDYRMVHLPGELDQMFEQLKIQISPRHVMRNWDREYFVETMSEHPYSVLYRHRYEQMKETMPLWIWLYGVTAHGGPLVVNTARRTMRRELHAALDARGYDPEGRLKRPKWGTGKGTSLKGDLKGTIALTARLPADVVKRLPKADLRAAMDVAVDRLIELKDAEQNPERWQREYDAKLEERARKEIEREDERKRREDEAKAEAKRREDEWREEEFQKEAVWRQRRLEREEAQLRIKEERQLRRKERRQKAAEEKRRIEAERPLKSGQLWA
ncbi:hypothetical protein BDP55DRAFT_640996 [Colletotrichum godetiae]|uniref:Uncharacterized protein n=1 Tax=Colletotrichum godetiae TaxID=1209918 RepID=A0AAJ0F338_9PEZI|nr:uncharacterized protein BDP55DRAFT_640996 [Colletotrichum godetiae]KAK1701251.1 hypothetical protein BDP55DRAFT_640996 [Colletotrichum godetiae]